MGKNPYDFLKGGRFNSRWLVENTILEAMREAFNKFEGDQKAVEEIGK